MAWSVGLVLGCGGGRESWHSGENGARRRGSEERGLRGHHGERGLVAKGGSEDAREIAVRIEICPRVGERCGCGGEREMRDGGLSVLGHRDPERESERVPVPSKDLSKAQNRQVQLRPKSWR